MWEPKDALNGCERVDEVLSGCVLLKWLITECLYNQQRNLRKLKQPRKVLSLGKCWRAEIRRARAWKFLERWAR